MDCTYNCKCEPNGPTDKSTNWVANCIVCGRSLTMPVRSSSNDNSIEQLGKTSPQAGENLRHETTSANSGKLIVDLAADAKSPGNYRHSIMFTT